VVPIEDRLGVHRRHVYRAIEVRPDEVRPAEVRLNRRLLVPLSVPDIDALSEEFEMLWIGH
jgi:hypothetical protein